VVRGRTIAYLGLSRTEGGDFLSSDDMDLVISLSGYVAIAIENARLYSSLERKVEEFERLKEFSENIVESINVGILAADLDDRVESWNTQIERLTGIARERAVGRRLSELPAAGRRKERERRPPHLQVRAEAAARHAAAEREWGGGASGVCGESGGGSAGFERLQADRAAGDFRRHHRTQRPGAQADAGR
jgi:GAF domain-containing protein